MNILNKKRLFLITTLVAFGVLIVAILMFKGQPAQEPASQNPPTSSVAPTASSTPLAQASSTVGMKTYTNMEFGFEFQYPDGWSFHENTFYSPFSKFNLVGASPEEKYRPDPLDPSLLVNIVTPDFADRAFYDLKNIASETSIGGVIGSRYEYEYEGSPKIAIILPFGQHKMILAAYKVYEDIFNQILATFKFLK